jgi:5'-nucleotidase
MRPLILFAATGLTTLGFAQRPLDLTILHNNDLHAHVESTFIEKRPYGGYARISTLVKRYRQSDKNVLLFNSGDTFQGTLYFNVYEGLADATWMNHIGYSAMVVGNHEFDKGPATLAQFLQNTTFPVLGANLDLSQEPSLKDLIKTSTIVKVGGQRVGVIGVVTEDTPDISSPGPTVKFLPYVAAIQREVAALESDGVNKIILLTHIGYQEDLALVPFLRGIDIVLGGHSHTPLGTPEISGWPKSRGNYPTLAKDSGGNGVPVLQAWEWGKVLGELKVRFDGRGRLTKWSAKPIVVDDSIPEDTEALALVNALRNPLIALQGQVLGEATGTLDRAPIEGYGDSAMSQVVADAMLSETKKAGAVVAFINAGGIRGSIEAGKITYGQAIGVQPFNNNLTLLDVTGAELQAALDQGAQTGGRLLPSEGTSYRLQSGKATEIVIAGMPLEPTETYRICLLGFTASGGDAHFVLKAAQGRRVDTGLLDIDCLIAYVKANSPIKPATKGRIRY